MGRTNTINKIINKESNKHKHNKLKLKIENIQIKLINKLHITKF